MTGPTLARAPDELVLRSIRKKALTTSIVVGYFSFSGLGMIAGALLDDNEIGRMAALFFAPLFLSGAAWFSVRGRGFFGGAQSEVGRLLFEPRGDVVWIYPHRMRLFLHGLVPVTVGRSVVIGCTDGRRFYLPVPIGIGDELESAVRACAPHAAFGFTDEREKRFRNDPSSLQLEGAPVGSRPMASSAQAVPKGGFLAAWRRTTREVEDELPGRFLRDRLERIPASIRAPFGLAGLIWAAYSVLTESGVYAWLYAVERKLTHQHSLVPALFTIVVCLTVAMLPLLVIAPFFPPKAPRG
jgi:hypothetical protein